MADQPPSGLEAHPIQLKTVVLESLHVDRLAPPPSDKPAIPMPIGASIQAEVSGPKQALAKLQVEAPAPGRAGPDKPPFQLQCRVVGVLESAEDTKQEDFETFIREQGLWLLWPYMRELVQSITLRMGVPPMVMPTIQIRRRPVGRDDSKKA